MSVGGRVAERFEAAVRQTQFGRALDVRDIDLKRIGHPGDFLPLKHSRLVDLSSVGVAFYRAARQLASQNLTLRPFDQVFRLGIKRIAETLGSRH